MNRANLPADLDRAVHERETRRLHRRLRSVDRTAPGHCIIDGREYLVFCSNDYLGLAHHPDLTASLRRAAAACGVGSTGAHLICGHHREHAQLEEILAAWTGRDRALLFSTGIMANLGVMQALLGRTESRREAVCLQDRLNHASLIDGARATPARLLRYPHADAEAAARQLARHPDAGALLATDGVFSMDGDIAPLAELAALCRREEVTMMVDDAHGIGVLGPGGAGSVAAAGLTQHDVPVLMGTLGKALGTFGAFVAGSAALIDGLVQFARSFVYTTAPPPALAAAARMAVRIARDADDRREILRGHIRRFRSGAEQLGLPLMTSTTPIQPLLLGAPEPATAAAEALERRGFLVGAIRPPTVPQGGSRLRITLSAAHTDNDIDQLLDALHTCIPPLAPHP